MARQKGIITIEGTLGNITFFKSQDGYMAREKSGVSADKIASDPAFERTRENNAEFGRAGKASKLLRTSVRPLTQKASDSRMVGRMLQNMMLVIHEDTVNPRGLRNVIDGEAALLQGFEFNVQGKLSATLFAPYTATFNRITGAMEVAFDAFIASAMVAAPAGSTHFKISLAGSNVDFEAETYEVQTATSAYFPWTNTEVAAFNLTAALTAASTHPVFTVLLIEFVQEVNGIKYQLKNGAFNAASIIKVDTP
jgi:hypothetical protein